MSSQQTANLGVLIQAPTTFTKLVSGTDATFTGVLRSSSLINSTSLSTGTLSSGAIVGTTGTYSADLSATNLVSNNNTTSVKTITNFVQTKTGNTIEVRPVTDGSIVIYENPRSTGWGAGDAASIVFGDSNHQIYSQFAQGMYFFDADGVRFGQGGFMFKELKIGAVAFNYSLNAGAIFAQSISFANAFVNTPFNVICSINQTTGSNWDFVNVQASTLTTTGFSATLRNTSGVTATGGFKIAFIAFSI